MATPQEQEAFIRKAAPGARRSFREFGVPASITIAQAALESAWGASDLSRQANNYFGIKAQRSGSHVAFGSIATGVVNMPTREDTAHGTITITAPFRKYTSMADSFRDHGNFLRENSRYKRCFDFKHDPNQFARELQKAGYATDRLYADKLIATMRANNLVRFDHGGPKATPMPAPKATPEPKPAAKPKPKPKPKPGPPPPARGSSSPACSATSTRSSHGSAPPAASLSTASGTRRPPGRSSRSAASTASNLSAASGRSG